MQSNGRNLRNINPKKKIKNYEKVKQDRTSSFIIIIIIITSS